jgi:acid phosphatase type 7
MNRRTFLKTAATATIAGVAFPDVIAAGKPAPGPKTPPPPLASITPPVLQNVSESAVSVVWSVSAPATGWVEFGETEALGRMARGGRAGLLPYDPRVLRVRVTSLKPGATYFYRVHTAPVEFKTAYDIRRGDAAVSAIYRFKTLDASAEAVALTIWNDTHQNVATLGQLIDRLPQYPADFLVWNGDIFNDVTTEDMLIVETLHPAQREYAATRPLMFACGNHDVRGAHARELDRTIEAPEGRRYYSFRHGPIAFLVLDTGEDKVDTHPEYGGLDDFASYRLEQRSWIERAIAQPAFVSAPFRVLLTHIPLRGPEHSADSRAKWEPLLASARIDFAISGHTHRYAYHAPEVSQPWPLLVGGGPKPEAATHIHVGATADRLTVRMFGLDARDLGHWEVPRRS